ncbi:MAG: HEAT repeat domain-containing protein [Gammaproteobacteria bacterium]|nr:HEAT repeat domain-containing protein [Gammaproteobacteria bacterium]MBU2478954.1 HEAT repeat domain-containing protein [Gammaproteobacteria bacterium]
MNDSSAQRPDALLLIANGCPHCPTVLQGLSDLVKSGQLGHLEVININVHPEIAQLHGVRGVPWLRIGPFQLTGLRSPAELAQWVQRVQSEEGMREYFNELLSAGDLAGVSTTLKRAPESIATLIQLLGDPDAELQIRLGVSAVLEDLEGSDALARQIDALGELGQHTDRRIRIDAAHALGLSHRPAARAYLDVLVKDADDEVREVATESLAGL